MITASPSRNVSLPVSREHSRLASPQESDAIGRGGRKVNQATHQSESDKQAIADLKRTVEKIRRRILGGSSQEVAPVSSSNWNYRGMWQAAPTSPYLTFDVVQMGSGTSAGMYLSVIDNNASAPDSGYGWVQVSTSAGTWL